MTTEIADVALETMARHAVPGVSAAVAVDGRVEWAQGWGVRTAGHPDPVTPDTLFQAGSISKPVAAVAALRLVAEGRLELDADVNDALVGRRVPPSDGWQPRVTLRQLLSHTGGLTVHGFPGYARDAAVPTLAQVLDGDPPANTPAVRATTMPGLQFSYSGGGYCVLQQLLGDVTGREFSVLLRELVLEPLGMLDSGYEQPLPRERWERAASGHRIGGGPVRGDWHVYVDHGLAGAVMSSSDSGWSVIEPLLDAIARAHDWPDFLEPRREAAAVGAQDLDGLVGTYETEDGARLVVGRAGDLLRLTYGPQPPVDLHPVYAASGSRGRSSWRCGSSRAVRSSSTRRRRTSGPSRPVAWADLSRLAKASASPGRRGRSPSRAASSTEPGARRASPAPRARRASAAVRRRAPA